MHRRDLIKQLCAGTAALAFPHVRAQTKGNVVVIGGGFGGATAAKYLREFYPAIQVSLIEQNAQFIACPLSNRVLHGDMGMNDITRTYERYVAKHGIQWIRATAQSVDTAKRIVTAGAYKIPYDRLIVAPGVDFMYENLPGMETVEAQYRIPHAWKAGEQTLQLKQMLQSMRKGGVVAMHIPKVPYRCPPGPYERASLIAHLLLMTNPKAKLFLYDSNPEIQSKKALFMQAWTERYKGLIEYVPNADIKRVDAANDEIEFDLHGKQKADVLNIIPPQRAGEIARRTGLANVGSRWCGVDFLTYESTALKNVHVIGDSIAGSPGMPKSGHMANQEGKVCAAAVGALLSGEQPSQMPIIANTCYSFVSNREAMHVAAVYRYDAAKKAMVVAPGSSGVSIKPSEVEAVYAMTWAGNILNDSLN